MAGLYEEIGNFLKSPDNLPVEFQSWLLRKVQDGVLQFEIGQLPTEVYDKVRPRGVYHGLRVAPPTEASDNDLFDLLVDDALGIVWRFRYRANPGSPYNWEFIGGPPLYAEITTSETSSSTTYVGLTTPGPSLTPPRNGDYLVEAGFTASPTGLTALQHLMSYDIGSTGAVDADATKLYVPGGASSTSVARTRRKNDLVAGAALLAKYRVTTSSGPVDARWMRVTPIRIS